MNEARAYERKGAIKFPISYATKLAMEIIRITNSSVNFAYSIPSKYCNLHRNVEDLTLLTYVLTYNNELLMVIRTNYPTFETETTFSCIGNNFQFLFHTQNYSFTKYINSQNPNLLVSKTHPSEEITHEIPLQFTPTHDEEGNLTGYTGTNHKGRAITIPLEMLIDEAVNPWGIAEGPDGNINYRDPNEPSPLDVLLDLEPDPQE